MLRVPALVAAMRAIDGDELRVRPAFGGRGARCWWLRSWCRVVKPLNGGMICSCRLSRLLPILQSPGTLAELAHIAARVNPAAICVQA